MRPKAAGDGVAAPAEPTVRRIVEIALFAVLPLLYLGSMYHGNFRHGFFDFHVFWVAANHVLAGESPYPTIHEVSRGTEAVFVYPAPMALLLAPFGLLPFQAAAAVFAALGVAAVVLGLRVLGIRDWRCYGAAFLWMTTMTGISTGTISPLLALGTAVLWRYRDRRPVAVLSAAAVVVAKLFMWPLLIWLVATRRTRTALAASVAAAASTLGAWAVLGFAGMTSYPRLLDELTATEADRSYSLLGVLLSFTSMSAARAVTAAVGLVFVVAIFVVGRRDERRGLVVAITAALLLSPILWAHYLVLLLVPIALASPRLTGLWFAPLAFWFLLYTAHNDGDLRRATLALLAMGVIAVMSLVGPGRLGRPAPSPRPLRVGTPA